MLEDHADQVRVLRFSSDGSKLASASNGEVIIWDLVTRKKEQMLEDHADEVTVLRFSSDGSKLASASLRGSVIVWNLVTGDRQHRLGHNFGLVTAIQFSPDDKQLVLAGASRRAILWNLHTDPPVLEMVDLEGWITDLDFSVDGARLETNIGCIELMSTTESSESQLAHPHHLQIQKGWIFRHGYKAIWLPSDLRPYGPAVAVRGDVIALGHQSGKISFWKIRA
jgi:WD40 repeat protein